MLEQFGKRKKKERKKERKSAETNYLAFEPDENFAYIVGYTSNGVPFGLTHEEFD